MIKTNQTVDGELSKDVFDKLGQSDLCEIMKEVYQLINVKNSVASLVDACAKEQSTTKKSVDKMNFDLKQQKFMLANLLKTEEMIRELDFCDQDSFPLLF